MVCFVWHKMLPGLWKLCGYWSSQSLACTCVMPYIHVRVRHPVDNTGLGWFKYLLVHCLFMSSL